MLFFTIAAYENREKLLMDLNSHHALGWLECKIVTV